MKTVFFRPEYGQGIGNAKESANEGYVADNPYRQKSEEKVSIATDTTIIFGDNNSATDHFAKRLASRIDEPGVYHDKYGYA
jgi:hypothetical protein